MEKCLTMVISKLLLNTDTLSLKEAIEKVQPKHGWLCEPFTSIHQNHKE